MTSTYRPQWRFVARRRAFLLLVAAAACGGCGAPSNAEPVADSVRLDPERQVAVARGGAGPVLPGIDVLLADSLHLVRGRRVGLITNPTGLDAAGRSTIDRLVEHAEVRLTTLFAPEHGLRADEGEGRRIADSRDPATGLPVVSLYSGAKRAPSADDLALVDVLVFDMQDVGARYYTYVSTMSLAMEAAGDAGIPFVVLDRPNPIGTVTQGNVLDPRFASFVGLHPVPMRHGMTVGELARLFQGRFGVEVELAVVPVAGWDPALPFEATGLPWVAPSPNLPDPTTALHYPGTCLFEGTNLSVGRGTDRPFQQIGAPGLDHESVVARLEARRLPGVRFEAVAFTPDGPSDGKWDGRLVHGVRFVATDPDRYDPTRAAVAALLEIRATAGELWRWNAAHFDRLAGTDALRDAVEAGRSLEAITATWPTRRAAFSAAAAPYLLYPR